MGGTDTSAFGRSVRQGTDGFGLASDKFSVPFGSPKKLSIISSRFAIAKPRAMRPPFARIMANYRETVNPIRNNRSFLGADF
jgi:hypothetical protein